MSADCAKPLAIDLFAGLGGWSEALISEGYFCVGFDIEQHEYLVPESGGADGGTKGTKPREKRGWTQGCAVSLGLEGAESKPRTKLLRYPGNLVIQDVLTLHGKQFKDAALIVASPPCQEYSYMAMPWSKAKAKAAAIRADATGEELARLNRLFDACFRIQREACEAAGRHIPLIVENVRGAIPWVGRSRWNFGSFHLWGDVPALMPFSRSGEVMKLGIAHRPDGATNFHGHKVKGFRFDGSGKSFQTASVEGVKHGGDWFSGYGGGFGWDHSQMRQHSSKSPARKMASAMIAKIPQPLARHIARTFKPK